MIKSDRARFEFGARAIAFHKTVPIQVQAKLHALRMKTGRPIHFLPRKKVMPLDAEPKPAKMTEQRLPSRADVAPCTGLAKRTRFAGGFASRAIRRGGFRCSAHCAGTIVYCGLIFDEESDSDKARNRMRAPGRRSASLLSSA